MIIQAIEPTRFRQALGRFCTGVTVVTAMDGAVPVGFACQAFAALSLDPPLVLFCPGKTSRSWPVIERAGSFCVNVLTRAQRHISTVFGTAGTDKFAGIRWTPAPSGAPALSGVLTWIDCALENVHEAGDHYVVIGRVTALRDEHEHEHEHGDRDEWPLLFFRGAYTAIEPAEPAPGMLDNLITWSRRDDWI
jgi:3-hydroxy-9,10-secoandrosta-1,3,5(10)-triene-9,17-dione monooxygenase reductase component